MRGSLFVFPPAAGCGFILYIVFVFVSFFCHRHDEVCNLNTELEGPRLIDASVSVRDDTI